MVAVAAAQPSGSQQRKTPVATIELCAGVESTAAGPTTQASGCKAGGGTGGARSPAAGGAGLATTGGGEGSRGRQPTGQPQVQQRGPGQPQGQGKLAALRRELAETSSSCNTAGLEVVGVLDSFATTTGLHSTPVSPQSLPDSPQLAGESAAAAATVSARSVPGEASPPQSPSQTMRLATLEARCQQLERVLAAKDAERRKVEHSYTGRVRGLEEHAARAARELERRERQVDELHLQGKALARRLTEREYECHATSERAAELEREVNRLGGSSWRGAAANSSSGSGVTTEHSIAFGAGTGGTPPVASGPGGPGGVAGGAEGPTLPANASSAPRHQFADCEGGGSPVGGPGGGALQSVARARQRRAAARAVSETREESGAAPGSSGRASPRRGGGPSNTAGTVAASRTPR